MLFYFPLYGYKLVIAFNLASFLYVVLYEFTGT